MSRSASSLERIVSFDSVSSIESKPANSARMSSLVRPRALRKTVTDCLRLRSMRTPTWSRLSISNSSHAPRLGMMRAETMSLSEVLSGVLVEVDAGRADELRHDDTLGAVDDERALAGLEREVAHEDRLGLDLTGLVVHELGLDVERGGVRLAALLALLDRVLLGLEVRVRERELHRLAQVLDRRDLLEDLLEAADLGHVGAADALRLGDARLPRRRCRRASRRTRSAARAGRGPSACRRSWRTRGGMLRGRSWWWWWMRCAQQPRGLPPWARAGLVSLSSGWSAHSSPKPGRHTPLRT